MEIEKSIKIQKAIFKAFQFSLLTFLNTDEGKYFLSKKLGTEFLSRIIDIGRNHLIEDTGERIRNKKILRGTFYSGQPFTDLLSPILEVLGKLERTGEVYFNPFLSLPRPAMWLESTFNPAVGANSPVNGNVLRNNANSTHADIRDGVGTAANVDPTNGYVVRYLNGTPTTTYTEIVRGVFLFDTSAIGADGTIVSAIFSTYVVTKSDPFPQAQSHIICSASPAANNTLVASDYNVANFGSVNFGSLGIAAMTTSAYNDITLNADGRNNISKTGISKFGVRTQADFDNQQTSWIVNEHAHTTDQFAGQTNKPKLVVTYTQDFAGII